jgi:hypothetical protein
MQFDFAFLATAAQIDHNRQFSVSGGGVEQLAAPMFPYQLERLAVVFMLRLLPTECNRDHDLRIAIRDAAHAYVYEVQYRFRAPSVDLMLSETTVTDVQTMHDVELPSPGCYAVQLMIDGAPLKELPLEVTPIVSSCSG